MHPTRTAGIYLNDQYVGLIGMIAHTVHLFAEGDINDRWCGKTGRKLEQEIDVKASRDLLLNAHKGMTN